MEDGEIIARLEERDESVIGEIGKKYSAYLSKTAKNVLLDDSDVEECVNETYFRVWQRIPPAKPANFALFIGKIARELAIDMYRTKTARKRRGSEYEASLDELGDLFSPEDDPADAADAEFLRGKISEFLRAAPEKTRKIFIRRYFLFDRVKTIARAYGLSESYVKVTLFRTREKLREFLEKEGIKV